MEGKLNLWLLEQINDITKKISGRIMQRMSLMGVGTMNSQQASMIMNQVVAPTVSGMVNIILMQTIIEEFVGTGGGKIASVVVDGSFDLSKLIDEEAIIDDMTQNLSLQFAQAQQSGGSGILK
jgi:hypothetical protein